MIWIAAPAATRPLPERNCAETVGEPLAVDVGDVVHAADAAQLLTRRAQHLLGGGVGVGQASLRVGRDDGDASRFGNGQERAFRSLQRHCPFCGERLGTAADTPLREQQHRQHAVERECRERGNARHDPLGRREARRARLEHEAPALATGDHLSHDGKERRAVDAVGSLAQVQHGAVLASLAQGEAGRRLSLCDRRHGVGQPEGRVDEPQKRGAPSFEAAERQRRAVHRHQQRERECMRGARITTQPDTSDQHDAPAFTRPLDAVQPRRLGPEIEAEGLPQVSRFRLEVGDRIMVGTLTCGPDVICRDALCTQPRDVRRQVLVADAGREADAHHRGGRLAQREAVGIRVPAVDGRAPGWSVRMRRRREGRPRSARTAPAAARWHRRPDGRSAPRRAGASCGRRGTSRAGTSAVRRSAPPMPWRGVLPGGPARGATRDRGLSVGVLA